MREFLRETGLFLIIIGLAITGVAGKAIYEWEQSKEQPGHADRITWDPDEFKTKKKLEFKKLTDSLYSITGTVGEDDCKDIVPQLPNDEPFALILESPGGLLVEGACLATHIKLRDVVTIIRNTPVLNEDGETLYEPGQVPTDEKKKGKVICASACSLMFLAGDLRYMIGDVYLGIHGPRLPDEALGKVGKRALETNAYKTAGGLLKLLEQLGVTNKKIQQAFIMIPGTSMYWVHPRDWVYSPELKTLATHYRNFYGYTGEQILPDNIVTKKE